MAEELLAGTAGGVVGFIIGRMTTGKGGQILPVGLLTFDQLVNAIVEALRRYDAERELEVTGRELAGDATSGHITGDYSGSDTTYQSLLTLDPDKGEKHDITYFSLTALGTGYEKAQFKVVLRGITIVEDYTPKRKLESPFFIPEDVILDGNNKDDKLEILVKSSDGTAIEAEAKALARKI